MLRDVHLYVILFAFRLHTCFSLQTSYQNFFVSSLLVLMDCVCYRPYIGLLLSFFAVFAGISAASNDGYILPSSGNASTTQFHVGPELASGTSCGVKGWANRASSGNSQAGGGPGFLYAAMNQLAFGANPTGT